MNDTVLRKTISYKVICGIADKKDEEVKAYMRGLAEKDAKLCSVAGEISGYSVKTGQYGENIAFNGEFIVQSAITGEVLESTKMFFDKGFADQVRARFDQRQNGAEMVQFSCEIFVVKHDKAPGFTYMARPLRTPEAVTRKASLMMLLASAAPAQLQHKPQPAKKAG